MNIRRRAEIEIIIDLLRMAKEPINKTQLNYKIGTCYRSFTKYLKILLAKNLVEEIPFMYNNPRRNPDRRTKYLYQTTKLGRQIIELMDKIYDTLEWH